MMTILHKYRLIMIRQKQLLACRIQVQEWAFNVFSIPLYSVMDLAQLIACFVGFAHTIGQNKWRNKQTRQITSTEAVVKVMGIDRILTNINNVTYDLQNLRFQTSSDNNLFSTRWYSAAESQREQCPASSYDEQQSSCTLHR